MLEQIVIQRIERDGPISFRDFMEMALYYPELGYYTSTRNIIGPHGDFLTSSYYSSLFWKLIAVQLEEMDRLIAAPQFTIVEYGAGTGLLCEDILSQLQNYPNLRNRIRYCIIEKSSCLRETQQKQLGNKVSWFHSISEIGSFTGCVLSNEVIDNFSVHHVVMEDELMEVFVGYKNGFVEILQPASATLKLYFDHLGVILPKGHRTEVNVEAIKWTSDIAAVLMKGFVLTIDYGYTSPQLYSQFRREGTTVCYQKHTINYSPYSNIGKQDITSHVNFSALHYWGTQNGLKLSGYTSQICFLLGLGLTQHIMTSNVEMSSGVLKDFVIDMGRKLKVLIQQKCMEPVFLKGLKFPEIL